MNLLRLCLAIILLSLARAQNTSLAPGFVGTFVLQPVGSSIATLSTTAQTVFTGTVHISVQPQMWYMEFDGVAPTGMKLTNTRRWSSPQANLAQNIEMSYYRSNDEAVEGCCSQTPLYDRFFIPLVNQYYGIRYAGRSATFLVTSPISNTVNVTYLEKVVGLWNDRADSGECPLRCLSPVDVVYVGDASTSINDNDWDLIRDFVRDFSNRFLFAADLQGARFGLLQFSAYSGDMNNQNYCDTVGVTGGSYQGLYGNTTCSSTGVIDRSLVDRTCILTANATDCTEGPKTCDWGMNYNDVIIPNGYEGKCLDSEVSCKVYFSEWALANCYDNTRILPDIDYDRVHGDGAGWALVDAPLTGNRQYWQYAVKRYTNRFSKLWRYLRFNSIGWTAIGQGMVVAGDQLEAAHRGRQQIMVTLSDGKNNRGIKVEKAVPLIKEKLNALDGPPIRFVSIGVGNNINPDQLLAAADGVENNVIDVADGFLALQAEVDRLVSLSCDAEYDLCQGTCAGFCSPCGDCLCPACPDLECQTSLGCDNGLCIYAEPERACCPAKLVEQCDKKGGVLNLEDCECGFVEGDGDNTFAVVGGTVGGLVGAVLLGILALLLLFALLAVLVTIVVLILKAQAIANVIATLGSNAFGAGMNSANPTYEGATLEGDNPLFSAAL